MEKKCGQYLHTEMKGTEECENVRQYKEIKVKGKLNRKVSQ